jgi:C-terminal processing protease CtpA/Prc
MVSRNNVDLGLQLDFLWQVTQDSDHYSFYEQGIPYLMLHTGLHDYYHRPSDDPERINRDGVRAVSQLLFRLAYEVAEGDVAPEFRAASRYESAASRAGFERATTQIPPRLGVSWSSLEDGHGLTLTSVVVGSAAERAGLRVGDRIISCDGRPTKAGDDFRKMILAADSLTQLMVERPGESDPAEVSVGLAGKPVRLGISWEPDQAEPSTVMLTQVVAGSAAEQAGLQARDRVYRVNGQDFAGSKGFADLVTKSAGPLQLLVERKGLLQDFTIQPLESIAQLATTAQKPIAE